MKEQERKELETITKQEAIQRIFPDEKKIEYSKIWNFIFLPQISAITGKPTIDPTMLDKLVQAKYGKYKTSFGEFIEVHFGKNVLEALSN